MRRIVGAIAIVALASATGCGGGSSSDDPSHAADPESNAAAIDGAGGGVQQRASREGPAARRAGVDEGAADQGMPRSQAPRAEPPDSRAARVRKAIAGLLHPGGKSQGKESHEGQGPRGTVRGLLDRIRRAARERLEQLRGGERGRPDDDEGPGILEMLR